MSQTESVAVPGRKPKLTAEPGKPETVLTWEFDAPRERVFRAWTDPTLLPQWLGPRNLTMTLEKFEPHTGGSWRYIHTDPEGKTYAFHGVFHEVLAPERIIQTFEFEGLLEPGHVLLETAKFEQLPGGRTRVTTQSVYQSVADRDGMLQSDMETGLDEMYERLGELLAKLRTEEQGQAGFSITRSFDAPRERVWQAWTDAQRLKRWWGAKEFTTPTWQLDLRVGGKYLYCMRSPEGKDYWGTGVYREIVPRERLVFTDSFADAQGNVVPATHYGMGADFPLELLVTVTFEEQRGKTTLTLHHAGMPAGPDGELARQGWNESFDKLADLLR